MNVTFQRAEFLRELRLLSVVVDRKATIPILAGTRLEALSSGDLACVTTNLEISLSARFALETVTRQGVAVVPIETLMGLTQRFPAGACVLDATAVSAKLSSNGSSAKLPTWAAEDFPAIAAPTAPLVSVPVTAMLRLIASARHAMGHSAHYPPGGHCDINDGQMRLAATDGHRIASASCGIGDSPASAQFGISDRAWDALAKVLSEEPGTAKVAIARNENVVWFSTEMHTLAVRVFDRAFPKFERVIPKEMAFAVSVNASVLSAALSRHLVLTSIDNCKVTIRFEKDRMVIASQTPRGGAEDVVAAEQAPDKADDVGINPRYLVAALEALSADRINFAVSTNGSVVVCRDVAAPDRMMALISTMR